jgi:hypothetical protein
MQRNRAFVSSQISNWTGTRPIFRSPQNFIVAKDSMVAWYTFQDSANDLATGGGFGDNTAYNLSTTNTSYVSNGFTAGVKSLSITESPASVVHNTSMPWSGNPNFSISMWIKRKADVKDGLWGIGGGAGVGQGINAYGLAFSPVNDIGWDLWAAQRFSTNQIYPLNEWIHVTWIKSGAMDQTGLRCVINGVEYSVTAEGGGSSVTPNLVSGFSLGDISANETRPVTAMEVFDVRIFNRNLTTAEAQQIHAAGLALLPPPASIEYLVIAGGGGGGLQHGGGGGAGGYRSSIAGESSGGGASAESVSIINLNTNYTVTVGAGGAGALAAAFNGGGSRGSSGSNSVFNNITSVGGGTGGTWSTLGPLGGGSGGGGNSQAASGGISGAAGTTNQGFAGASGGPVYSAGGGGGAESAGMIGPSQIVAGDGGSGATSSITGTPIKRAGGGGGGVYVGSSPAAGSSGGLGGTGGGGAGGWAYGSDITGASPQNATTNTGSGGGGNGTWNTNAGNGASGVVILRYDAALNLTVGSGLVSTTSTVGSNKVTTFTSGTGTISLN